MLVIATGSYSSEYRSSNYISRSVQALLGMNISQIVMFVIARGKQWLNLTDGYTIRVLRQNNKIRVHFLIFIRAILQVKVWYNTIIIFTNSKFK